MHWCAIIWILIWWCMIPAPQKSIINQAALQCWGLSQGAARKRPQMLLRFTIPKWNVIVLMPSSPVHIHIYIYTYVCIYIYIHKSLEKPMEFTQCHLRHPKVITAVAYRPVQRQLHPGRACQSSTNWRPKWSASICLALVSEFAARGFWESSIIDILCVNNLYIYIYMYNVYIYSCICIYLFLCVYYVYVCIYIYTYIYI